jgi:benzoylformate decarboxylase
MFGNPGTTEEGFLDVLGSYPELQYITCLHESVAVTAAEGYSRKNNSPALVQLHSGVGLGNAIGVLYQSLRGHAPLVVIAGDSGIKYDSLDAQMACDLAAMARPVTKWSGRVVHKDSVLRTIRKAVKIATTPPYGPVFVALPMDILDQVNTEIVQRTVKINTDVCPADDVCRDIADILSNAENPVLIIGDGVTFDGAKDMIEETAACIAPKVYGADNSLINFSHDLPCWCGDLGHMFGSDSKTKVKDADVVLIAGTYIFPEVFAELECPFSPNAKIIHIDLNAYEIAKNHRVDIAVCANIKSTLAKVNKLLPKRNVAAVGKIAVEPEAKTVGELFMKTLARKAVGKDIGMGNVTIFDEALTFSPNIGKYFSLSQAGKFFQTRGGSLGVGFPGAIGIKLAAPNETVIGFSGDGGCMYTIQSLYTAARYGIGAKFVVCNNHSYKLLENNITRYWDEQGIKKHDFPVSFPLNAPLDYVGLAKSLGVNAVRVQSEKDVQSAVEQMLEQDDVPFLIELVTA